MNKIMLNDKQLNNLQAFLQRVELKGNEVPAFVEIMQILSMPNKKEQSVVKLDEKV